MFLARRRCNVLFVMLTGGEFFREVPPQSVDRAVAQLVELTSTAEDKAFHRNDGCNGRACMFADSSPYPPGCPHG
jgi:hypothetical protein